MSRKVLLSWELSNRSGWGILGLNLFCQWAARADIIPVMVYRISDEAVALVDPLRRSVISKAIAASNDVSDAIERVPGSHLDFDGTVIDPIAQNGKPTRVFGKSNIGRCIFVSTNIGNFQVDKFDALLCASTWNADVVRQGTGRSVDVILEGIDPSLFCPGPRSGILNPDKFYVFSGGKVEFRKGQDLVLRAFREFSRRHADAVLVTAWHSPWPTLAARFKGTLEAPLELDENGLVNIKKWAADNGIDPSRVIEIFLTPNQLMPTLLREMHVALQPSRAEPCTNLIAMEAMACGVPVIVGDNTGMRDLITDDNCVRLSRQEAVPPSSPTDGTVGWGESSVDEMVEALEMLHGDAKRREAIGVSGARWIREHLTWEIHAQKLKDLVLSLRG